MTELETMLRAKMYIDKLANGIDPISDTEMPNDTILNNVKVVRCFFYVSQVLDKVIQNGGKVENQSKKKKIPFSITKEQIELVEISHKPISISDFCKLIDNAVNNEKMKNLSSKIVTDWLVSKDFLQIFTTNDGRKRKGISDNSKLIGITEEQRCGQYGPYTVNLYDFNAQKFILDNLESILAENQGKS